MRRAFLTRLWALAFGLLLSTVVAVPQVHAHESRPASLQITETAPSQFEVLWRMPMRGTMPLPVVLQMPSGVIDLSPPLVQDLSDSRLERRWIETGSDGFSGQKIGFPGLEMTITEAVVRVSLLDGRSWMSIARPTQPWVTFSEDQGVFALAADFTRQGFEHILSGFDHLVFVFGLMLLVPNRWMLVKTVTAFTVAHSITLGVATFGYIRPPSAVIEAAIAMSILFLGVEILRARRGGASFSIERPWLMAFAFGLLHGFGFAAALAGAGLPQSAISIGLLFFNIGVEIGQLAFVAVILAVVYGLSRLSIRWPQPLGLAPAYIVGSFGAFWMLQRLSMF